MSVVSSFTIGNTNYDIVDETTLSNIATIENTSVASKAYAKDDYLVFEGVLYKVTAPISQGGTITVGTNVAATTVTDELGSGGHTIKNPSGTSMAQREGLQFKGNGINVSDDSTNNQTVVTVPGLGTKVSATVSDDSVTFSNAAITSNSTIDGPYIQGVLVGVTEVTEGTNSVTFTLSDDSADGNSAYIWVRE